MFTIEMLPASLGDSLWIEYGDAAHPSRILIDGGLVGTFDSIEERIRTAAERDGGRCRLDLLVLSHVDADHIEGLIKLLGTKDLPLDVDDLWFNGWHHLPDPTADRDDEFLGAKQGEFLGVLIRERGLPWNQAFGGDTIYVPTPEKGTLPRRTLHGGMELTLLSPTFKELLSLSRKWEEELEKAGLLHASHEELLEALKRERKLGPDEEFLSEEAIDVAELVGKRQRRDSSAANGSSIAFVGEFEGKRCLFAGDAYWNVLRDTAARLAEEEDSERLALDAFKIPHHGSRNNVGDELLSALDCHRFLISTNGSRFKHPDDEAIARLVGGPWRGSDPSGDDEVVLEFNYRTEFNEGWDEASLRDQWNYRARYPSNGAEGLIVEL